MTRADDAPSRRRPRATDPTGGAGEATSADRRADEVAGPPPERVVALAPAKVNLALEVLGRRPDGYHEIETALLALELADRLEVRRTRAAGEVVIEVAGEHATGDVPAGPANLAVRAAQALLDQARAEGLADARTGIAIRLEKAIPSQAGLGGASSDAAAAALATARVLGLAPDPARIDAVLARLGSDCVFFARASATGCAWCSGRGEQVEPVSAPWPELALVVLTPDVRCPTGAVYAALAEVGLRPRGQPTLRSAGFELPIAAARALFFNRLEEVALAAVPALRPWREALDGCDAAHFRLAGSGSSFFGAFDGMQAAERARARILAEVRTRGLVPRGAWSTRPARAGARVSAG